MVSDTPLVFPFGILGAGDPHPVGHERRSLSRIVIVCEHAGNAVPSSLDLGVREADLARHIALDIGALGVARTLSARLDAELLYQRYSRLVIDCNRPPGHPTAFPARVDGTAVPGNDPLAPLDAAARTAEIFHPFAAAVSAALDRRTDAEIEPVLVAIHSFTPHHTDFPGERPWPISVLFDKDPRLSLALAQVLRREDLDVGENVPYQVGVLGDYTVPVHGEGRGIAHTLIEIRQDLIAEETGQREWGERLARALPSALALMGDTSCDTAAPGRRPL